MISPEWIAQRVLLNEYIITQHAELERRNDSLSIAQLEEVLMHGTIIEEYPEDARGTSCLVFGKTGERDVHVVCGKNAHNWLVIITTYIPTLPKWKSATERNRS